MSAIEYSGAATRSGSVPDRGLFHGITFWLARQVPSRSHFKEEIIKHGGTVTEHEENADLRIHDHARRGAPSGAYSYTFIEESIRRGVLENKNKHNIGAAPGAVKKPGEIKIPTKSCKKPFTTDEDCELWDVMTGHLAAGGTDGGNKIYQEIQASKPNHTFHSWRDRWLKHLRDRPRPLPLNDSATIDPPRLQPAVPTVDRARHSPAARLPVVEAGVAGGTAEKARPPVRDQSGNVNDAEMQPRSHPSHDAKEAESQPEIPTEADEEEDEEYYPIRPSASDEVKVWRAGHHILDLDSDHEDEAWENWAAQDGNEHYNAQEWKQIYDVFARPVLQKIRNSAFQEGRNSEVGHDNNSGEVAAGNGKTLELEHVENRSQGAKANSSVRRPSSVRRTIGRIESNPESTISQPTDQERAIGGAERKRKRATGNSPSRSSIPETTDGSKRRRTSESEGSDPEIQGESQQVDEEAVVDGANEDEDIDPQPPSPSLTEPALSHQSSTKITLPSISNAVSQTEPDSHPNQSAQTVSDATEDTGNKSPDSSTTTPGNTARQYPPTPTPRRRDKPANSSQASTTTTPGNTAPMPLASTASLAVEDDRDNIGELDEQSIDFSDHESFMLSCAALGYSADDIEHAMDAAGGDLALAVIALRALKRTGQLPQNEMGIWTAQDDDDLISSNAERRKSVQEKHGKKGFERRLEYLDSRLSDD